MPFFPQACHQPLARAAACLAIAVLPGVALAQSEGQAPRPKHVHAAAKPAPHHNKVLDSMERGTSAAGRGIERGADATRRGVDHTAERASAPVRRWGEALGRKVTPGAAKHPAAPAVGPQGNAP